MSSTMKQGLEWWWFKTNKPSKSVLNLVRTRFLATLPGAGWLKSLFLGTWYLRSRKKHLPQRPSIQILPWRVTSNYGPLKDSLSPNILCCYVFKKSQQAISTLKRPNHDAQEGLQLCNTVTVRTHWKPHPHKRVWWELLAKNISSPHPSLAFQQIQDNDSPLSNGKAEILLRKNETASLCWI